MSDGTYWCLRVPNGVCGCLFASEGTYWLLRVPTDAYWFLSVPNGI